MQDVKSVDSEERSNHFSATSGSVGICQALPAQIPDYANHARSLISQGYCTIKIPSSLRDNFWRMVLSYSDISPHIKEVFSFPERTDGFLPFGMERARSTNRVDLCERFCYRQNFRLDHHAHSFSQSPMYAAATACEVGLSAIAEQILAAICLNFEVPETIAIRDNSYMQFCSYDARFRRDDREYLQDRHEDGNLITLAKASCDGLVIFPGGVSRMVDLADDEIIVFTGSLLTALSDGRIPYMDHAVLSPPVNVSRSSLVYFALPELDKTYASLVRGEKLNLDAIANELHQGFGNHPFIDSRPVR